MKLLKSHTFKLETRDQSLRMYETIMSTPLNHECFCGLGSFVSYPNTPFLCLNHYHQYWYYFLRHQTIISKWKWFIMWKTTKMEEIGKIYKNYFNSILFSFYFIQKRLTLCNIFQTKLRENPKTSEYPNIFPKEIILIVIFVKIF